MTTEDVDRLRVESALASQADWRKLLHELESAVKIAGTGGGCGDRRVVAALSRVVHLSELFKCDGKDQELYRKAHFATINGRRSFFGMAHARRIALAALSRFIDVVLYRIEVSQTVIDESSTKRKPTRAA